MNVSRHNIYKKTIAVGLTAALGVTACSSGKKSSAERYSTAPSSDPTTTTIVAPATPLITGNVIAGPVASLKDVAFSASLEIDDIVPVADTKGDVSKARQIINRIANVSIRQRGNDYVDDRLAKQTTYADFYTFPTAKVSDNIDKVNELNGVIGLIANPTIKQMAQAELNAQEAKAAIMAGTSYTPNAQILASFLSLEGDPALQSLAKQVIGGDATAKTTFASQLGAAEKAVNEQESAGYFSLYNGSNSQAKSINEDIQAFNKAVQADGQ